MRPLLTALFIACLLTAAGFAQASGTSISITLVLPKSAAKVNNAAPLPRTLESPWVPWWLSAT